MTNLNHKIIISSYEKGFNEEIIYDDKFNFGILLSKLLNLNIQYFKIYIMKNDKIIGKIKNSREQVINVLGNYDIYVKELNKFDVEVVTGKIVPQSIDRNLIIKTVLDNSH